MHNAPPNSRGVSTLEQLLVSSDSIITSHYAPSCSGSAFTLTLTPFLANQVLLCLSVVAACLAPVLL